MTKPAYILLALFFACSSSDNSDDEDISTFMVSVTQDLNSTVIDQMVTLTATTTETINSIDFSLDGGTTYGGEYSTNFGNTAKLYLDFDTVGTKNIVFRIKNNDGEVVDKVIIINVERGNAIQINNLQLNSFYNIGKTWDTEFSDTDSNRLADVFFAILKPSLNVYSGIRSTTPNSSWSWYRSQTRDNESNLSWNLQNEALFINLDELTPWIAFADDDGGNISQDLMLGPPYERTIPISNFVNTKSNTILVEETNINLEYELSINW